MEFLILGDALLENENVLFVGSTPIGERLFFWKKDALGGAKNHMVVMLMQI